VLVVNSFLKTSTGGGLGDFIRGSFRCLQVCNQLGYNFTLTLKDHPIKGYFKPSHYARSFDHNIKTVDLFQKYHRRDEFKAYLRNKNRIARRRRTSDSVIVICSNLLLDASTITAEERSIISSFFEFTEETQDKVSFKLIENNTDYECIHVRCGDYIAFNHNSHLKSRHEIIEETYKNIKNKIVSILDNTSKPVVLLSDSKEIRDKLSNELNIVSPQTNTYHSAFYDGDYIDLLKDLHILRNCSKIYQLTNSFHWWGSSFSQIATYLDDVPLIQLKY